MMKDICKCILGLQRAHVQVLHKQTSNKHIKAQLYLHNTYLLDVDKKIIQSDPSKESL